MTLRKGELVISHPEAHDIPVLEQLWMDTFGDASELVEAFFDAFPPAVHGWVLRRGSKILSSAYLLHGNLFLSETQMRAAAYVYAVATPSSQRGNGYGGILMRHFSRLADENDLVLYTRPASPGLFQWYANVMQTRPAIGMHQKIVCAGAAPAAHAPRRVSPEEYGRLRETYLKETAHIALSAPFLALQEHFFEGDNAGYYAVGPFCCACEQRDEHLIMKELLAPADQIEAAAQAMLKYLTCAEAIVYTPSAKDEPTVAFHANAVPPDTYWGLLLD